MIYNLFSFSDVGAAIMQAMRTFLCYIAALLFDFLSYLYNIFMLLSNAQILNNDLINSIYRKAGLILGLFMTFKLVFSLIQALIDPDKLTDNKKGVTAVVMRLVFAIVLLGITPSIFREAMNLQRILIGGTNSSDNIIYKLIVGDTSGISVDNFGRTLSVNVFFSFYTDNGYDMGLTYDENLEERYQLKDYKALKESILNGSSFTEAITPLTIRKNGVYVIDFNPIVIIIAGVLIWMIFMYCFQVAVRVFQLAFLQLIAPIPILSYVSDPEGNFKKWYSTCISTYLDLFLRLAIIYFVIYIATIVSDNLENCSGVLIESLGNPDGWMAVWLLIFLLIGLFMFAMKVPDLIKDLFPALGGAGKFSFGLNPKKELFDPLSKVGKTVWNSPIGWLPKLGMRAGTSIDRKVHGLPAPRSKFGQAMDKWLPGRAEQIKNKRQAKVDIRRDEEYEKAGAELYSRYGDKLPSEAFKNKEYRQTYQAMQDAKKYEGDMQTEYKNRTDEYRRLFENSKDPANDDNVKRAYVAMKIAEKNAKVAATNLETAKKNHDRSKQMYTSDATRENQHARYKDTHTKSLDYDDANAQQKYVDEFNKSMNSYSSQQQAQTTQQQQQQSSSPHIDIAHESHRPRPDPNAPSREQVMSEYDALKARYDNEQDPNVRKQIKKELEDFERKH